MPELVSPLTRLLALSSQMLATNLSLLLFCSQLQNGIHRLSYSLGPFVMEMRPDHVDLAVCRYVRYVSHFLLPPASVHRRIMLLCSIISLLFAQIRRLSESTSVPWLSCRFDSGHPICSAAAALEEILWHGCLPVPYTSANTQPRHRKSVHCFLWRTPGDACPAR